MAFLKFNQANGVGPIFVQEEYVVSIEPKTEEHLGVLTTTKGKCTIIDKEDDIVEMLLSKNSELAELNTLLDFLEENKPSPVPVQTKPHPMEYIAEEGE